MDVRMAAFVLLIAALAVWWLFYVLSVAGLGLWYAWGAIRRRLESQPSPWRNAAATRVIKALALLVAIILIAHVLFRAPTDVYRNPRAIRVRIEFRQLSGWQSLVGPKSSDGLVDILLTHVSADGKRTTVKIIESSPEYQEHPGTIPERRLHWATNSSGRVVVRTNDGDTLFLPDLLPVPDKVSAAAVLAYLQGQPTNIVRQILVTPCQEETLQ